MTHIRAYKCGEGWSLAEIEAEMDDALTALEPKP